MELTRIRALRSVTPIRERELPDVARSVAIIMDGNGRWARRRGLPVAAATVPGRGRSAERSRRRSTSASTR